MSACTGNGACRCHTIETLFGAAVSPAKRTFDTGATRDTEDGKLDLVEIGWAAGLFDGEGSVTVCREGLRRKDGTRRSYPKLYVGNTNVELLTRFCSALGGIGKVRGPYGRYGREGQPIKPMFHWTATHRSARAAAALLLPYVSAEKGEKMELHFGGEWTDGRYKKV